MADWREKGNEVLRRSGYSNGTSVSSGEKWRDTGNEVLKRSGYSRPASSVSKPTTTGSGKSNSSIKWSAIGGKPYNDEAAKLVREGAIPGKRSIFDTSDEYVAERTKEMRSAYDASKPERNRLKRLKKRRNRAMEQARSIMSDVDRFDSDTDLDNGVYLEYARIYDEKPGQLKGEQLKIGERVSKKIKDKNKLLDRRAAYLTEAERYDKEIAELETKLGSRDENGVRKDTVAAAKENKQSADAISRTLTTPAGYTDQEIYSALHGDLYSPRIETLAKQLEKENKLKGQVELARDKSGAYEYYNKHKDDTYSDSKLGFAKGNYRLGDIGEREGRAGYTSYKQGTSDIEAANVYQSLSARIQSRNQKALKTNGLLDEQIANVAQYVPQFINQTKARIPGAAAGAALGLSTAGPAGVVTGMRLGGSAAVADYMFKQTAGNAYLRHLRDSGLSTADAKRLATSEAIPSGLIEFGLDFALSGLFAGAGKATSADMTRFGKKSAAIEGRLVKAMINKGLSQRAAETAIGVAKTAGKVAVDSLGEGAEEWLQSALEKTADRAAKEGKSLDPLQLVAKSFDFSAYTKEELADMNKSFIAGAVIGLAGTPAQFARYGTVNKVLGAVDDRKLGSQIRAAGETENVIREGLQSTNSRTKRLAAALQNSNADTPIAVIDEDRRIGQLQRRIVDEKYKALGDKYGNSDETVDALVRKGLDSEKDSSAHKYAKAIQDKRSKGQYVTQNEVDNLIRLTEQAIAGEGTTSETETVDTPINAPETSETAEPIQGIGNTETVAENDTEAVVETNSDRRVPVNPQNDVDRSLSRAETATVLENGVLQLANAGGDNYISNNNMILRVSADEAEKVANDYRAMTELEPETDNAEAEQLLQSATTGRSLGNVTGFDDDGQGMYTVSTNAGKYSFPKTYTDMITDRSASLELVRAGADVALVGKDETGAITGAVKQIYSPVQDREAAITQAIRNTLDTSSETTQGLMAEANAVTGTDVVSAMAESFMRNGGVPDEFTEIFTDGGAAVNAAINGSRDTTNISVAEEGATNNDFNGVIPERTDNADGNVGRGYSERAGEPGKGVLGGAETVQANGRERAADTALPVSRQSFTRTIKETEAVTEQIINTASGDITINVISAEAMQERDDAQNIIRSNGNKGIKTVFYTGYAMLGDDASRGFVIGDTIYIMYDNEKYTPEQINDHELTHTRAKSADFMRLRDAVMDGMTDDELRRVYMAANNRYAGEATRYVRDLVRKNGRMTKDNRLRAYAEYIWQELIADLNGRMDEMAEFADRFEAEIATFKGETVDATEVVAEADTSSEAATSPAEYAEETDAGGAKHSFAGERAATADRSLLQQAQQMEQDGATPGDIWRETGWGKGADGKWRFEIDDADMQLKKVEYAKMRHTEHGSTRLSDLIRHKQLFEQYPHLASLVVSFDDLDGARGQHSRSTQRITLDESLKNNEAELKEVLIHELQHAIQQYEGFAGGANPGYWQDRIDAKDVPLNEGFREKVMKARKELSEVMNNNPQLFIDVRDLMMSLPTVPRGEVDLETLEQITPDPPEWQEFDRRRDELAERYGEFEVFDVMDLLEEKDKYQKLMNNRSAYSLYYNTAGEIEARDASNRSELVAEERREKYPKSMKPDADRVFAEGSDARFSKVTDKDLLNTLENGKTEKVYRAMQVIDGELYPPMAARVKSDTGKKNLVEPSQLGVWEQADERPDLIKDGKFELDKANGSAIKAAYNPYFHTSRSPLNDQFSSAYKRNNLVIVEGEVPSSELTSGYKAEYAKDPVGEMKWHSGVVSSKLKGDKARRVILSRWFKPTRIVPDAEVAEVIANILDGENIKVPYNVVTPSLRQELEKAGVEITDDYNGKKKTADDARFSLSSPIEETRDLIAAHNISARKLSDALDLGGLAMPSLAITKADMGYDDFGSITLLFDKSTIDPETNKANKVYGGDAYTPTFPQVINKPKDAEIEKLAKRLGKTKGYVENRYFDNVSPEEAKQRLKDDVDIKKLFAKEIGIKIAPIMAKVGRRAGSETDKFLLSHDFDEFFNNDELVDRYFEAIRKDLLKLGVRERLIEERETRERKSLLNARTNNFVRSIVKNDYNEYVRGAKGEYEVDARETEKEYNKIIKERAHEFDEFVENIIREVLGERYIKNGKPYYTPKGRKRRFDQLYDEYTLGNVIKNMRGAQQQKGDAYNPSVRTIRAAASKNYKNIADVKVDSERIIKSSSNDLDDDFIERFRNVAERATGTELEYDDIDGGARGIVNSDAANFADHIIDSLNKSKTKAAFERNMRAYPDIYKIDNDLMRDIEQLLEDMRNAPVKYFEAKPQRAVGFDEVVAAIVPDDTDETLIQRLQDYGIQVLTYKNGDSASRLEKVNSVPEVRFSKADDIHTPQFKDWFGDWENDPENASKVVNEDGTPKVVYHGTSKGGFTVFDTFGSLSRYGLFGNGAYFTADPDIALTYTKKGRGTTPQVYKAYLSIKTPIDMDAPADINRWNAAFANADYYTRAKSGDSNETVFRRFEEELSDQYIPKWEGEEAVRALLEGMGFDGITHLGGGRVGKRRHKVFIAFYPEQIKSATDNIGTYDKTNPDIRYSIEKLSTQDLLVQLANGISYRDDLIKAAKKNRAEVRELISEKKQLRDSLANAKRQMVRTKVPRASSIETAKTLKGVIKALSSKADAKELASRVLDAYNTYFKEMHDAGYVEALETRAAENMVLAFQDIAEDIVAAGEEWTSGEDYKDLVTYLRGTRIKVPENMRSDIQYSEYRKRNFGTLTLANDGLAVDAVYMELCSVFPHLFSDKVTNPADQLEAIEDTVNSLRPKAYNPHKGYEAEALEFAVDQFVSATDSVVEKKTKADKAYEKAQKEKAAALEKQRQGFEAKTEKLKAEAEKREEKLLRQMNEQRWARYWDAENAKRAAERQKYQAYWEKRLAEEKSEAEKAEIRKRLDRLREQKDAQAAKLVEHKDEVIANIRERRKVSILKAHIRKTANDLSARLKNPKGAPAELVKSIAEICSKLDFTTDRTGKGGGENKSNLRLLELKKSYDALANDPDYDIASEYDAEMSARIDQLDNVLKGKRIGDLDVQELADLDDVLKQIKHAIINANKQIGKAEARTNKELGQSVIDQLNAQKGFNSNVVKQMLTGYRSQVLNPMRLAELMSGYDKDSVMYGLFNDLNAGLRKQAKFTMDARKPFDELVNGKGNGRLHQEFVSKLVKTDMKYPDGKPVELPKSMICELIMLWDRKQGRSHLEKGGFTVPEFKKYNTGNVRAAFTTGQKTMPGVTEEDIAELRGMLNEYDKLWMARARKLFNEVSTNAINTTSMLLTGRKIATTENYIPIHTDKNYVRTEIEGLKLDATIEGNGSLKSVAPNAPQPVYLMGLDHTALEHIDFVGRYYGLAIPIRNFNKVYNVSVVSETGKRDSVKRALGQKWGANVVKFGVEQLLTDLQTSRQKPTDPLSKALGTIQSNWVSATLNANISVCIKQAASYPTAMYVVGTKPLAKALAARAGVKHADLLREIDDHTGLHYLRRIGLSTQELGDRAGSNTLINRVTNRLDSAMIDKGISSSILPSNWIQTVDVATTETLWLAAKYYVEDEMKIKPDADGYWQKVTDTYESIIEETQPNYDVMHRPEIQKTTNAITRTLVMFATQPLQNSGILYSSIGNLAAKNAALSKAKKAYESNKTAANKEAYETAKLAARTARGRLARGAAALVTSAVTFVIMNAIARFALHNVKRYRDETDEGKVSIEKVLRSALDDLKGQAVTMALPAAGSTVMEFIGNIKDGYDYEIPITQMYNDTKDAINKLTKTLSDINGKDARLPLEDKLKLFEKPANSLLKVTGEFAGVPIANTENIVTSVQKYIKDAKNGEIFSSDINEFKPKYVYSFADLAGSIVSGNAEKEQKIYTYFKEAGREVEKKDGSKEINRAQLTKYVKPAYVECVESDPREARRIKKVLIDRYGYQEKTIDKWLEDDDE